MSQAAGAAGGRALPWAARILAALYMGAGVAAMWLLAPRVPYADAWRHLARFVATPFPGDILRPDNGHHEVLPNIVRVLELRLFDGGQTLQIATGLMLALATLLAYWRGVGGLDDPRRRLAALLAAAVALFWLGNVRALAHGNESVHAYLVTLCLALGLHALVRSRGPAAGALLAGACGLAASFSFGSGFASFAAFGLVLALRRAGLAPWCVLAGAAALTLALLQLGGGSAGGLRFAPAQQLSMLLAWLSGPSVYAAWPLLDPQVAAQLPSPLRMPVGAVAHAYESAVGPAMGGPWPQLLAGAAGLGWLAALCRCARHGCSPAMAFGLGTAVFALAVGGMIVLVRFDYFAAHPGQLLAPRYLVWSSLFWGGLAIATAATARRSGRVLASVVLVAAALLPSQAWMGMLGARMAQVAERSALAATVGVLEPELPLGETVPGELAEARPVLRDAAVAVFAWPEAAWQGRDWPGDATRERVPTQLEVQRVPNRLGPDGRRLRFRLDASCHRLLLLDRDGRVAGMARSEGDGWWLGWMRGTGPLPPQPAACAAS